MLHYLILKARERGLEVHEGKTKIISNGMGRPSTATRTEVDSREFTVLSNGDSTMYLGRLLNLRNTQDTELEHRINKAWAKFGTFREELTNKSYPLHHRMRLFSSIVQPTLLYGCATWVMTRTREDKIRRVQRKMLRSVVGVRRKTSFGEDGQAVLEEWVPWMRRATRQAEIVRDAFAMPDWVDEVARRRFRWAGHVARRCAGRWNKVVLEWSLNGIRAQGRPLTRWSDQLNKFFTGLENVPVGSATWMSKAQDREQWKSLEDVFVKFCARRVG